MWGIPDVIWAAVIASLLTLGGVFLTNKGSNNRLFSQLKHDSEQRNRDREMSLRRDVYLNAAKAISEALSAIGRISDIDLTNEEIGKHVSECSSAIDKIHVIGNEATVFSTAKFSFELGYVYLKLVTDRMPLIKLNVKLSILGKSIERANKERDGLVEMMKDYNLKGSTDRRLWELINSNFDFQGKQLDKYFAEAEAINRELKEGHIKLIKIIHENHRQLRQLLVPALFAIRKEIELPIDEVSYRKLIEEEMDKEITLLDGWLEKMLKFPNA